MTRERGRFKVYREQRDRAGHGWGAVKAFKVTSNSAGSTPATGYALAYKAGADLMDMEFVQFHPTGMVWPPSGEGHPRDRGRAR